MADWTLQGLSSHHSQAHIAQTCAVTTILCRHGSLRVLTERHGDRRAAVAVGARSVIWLVGCGSYESFERESSL